MQTILAILTIFFLQFTDKVGSERVCLSELAMQMREQRGIVIDSMDYEVSPIYLDSVRAMGARILHTSRWLNGATIELPMDAILPVEQCDFIDTMYVTREEGTNLICSSISLRKKVMVDSIPLDIPSVTTEQHVIYNLLPLHQIGYKGQGIRIGLADGGFYNADSLSALPREKWLGYADFTDDTDDFFGTTGNHGTLCLTTIMAQTENYEGSATEAKYFLFRTEEHYTESPKEIDNWVAAIEMADSLGLHIVSTSLGYTTFDNQSFNFAYEDMNGHTSRGAQAAIIAARKGMLLVMAIGNDGNNAWHYLSTPADADSILTVGAVDIAGDIANFSSYGPSADGRVKPEVCAVGKQTSLLNPSNEAVQQGNGTSFACPLLAGMAACLWSALPNATNMEIRERIIRSANRYAQPHEQYGYGIPNAWKAYTMEAMDDLSPIVKESLHNKIIQNGRLYILHNGYMYDILGNKIAE
ncbi:MAG: S8 family serine peptidase [Paludibacteraceae bacterium]|nr:S8 family serine peptidase [Paludibacteraceae bacterium]